MIIAAKLVCLVIWIGAATSKLNKHFPFVISTMMSNNPVLRPRWIKRKFFEHFPDDLRPGPAVADARALQHRDRGARPAGAVLLPRRLADGDRRVRHAVLPLRHPVVDPDGRAAGVERVHDVQRAGAVRRARRTRASATCTARWPIVLFVVVAGTVVLGNLFPRKVSFLPGMRYYAGNWDTTLWCIKPSAEQKIANGIVAIASMPQAQMEKFYGSPETAQMYHLHGIRVPRLQHSRPRDVHPRAPGDGRTERGRLHRSPTASGSVQHRHRLELRRRPHAQRAADRRAAGAVPLRTGRGARRAARRAADPRADARSTGSSTPPPANSNAATSRSPTWSTRQPWDDTVPVHVTAVTTSTPRDPVLVWIDETPDS